VPELRIPARLRAVPPWVAYAVGFLALAGLSVYLHLKYINGQFWEDEGLSVGISSHSLSAIPGVLRHDGSPPLYYVLLHFWMRVFGDGEVATHWMSLIFSAVCVPLGGWTAWRLWGRRAGLSAIILFALNAFLSNYGQESRMYSLMALLGLIATAGFLRGFVYRQRRHLVMFSVGLALMLYTHAWGIFFGAGAALALVPVWYVSDDRRALLKDAVISFVAAGVLFLPWLPNFIYQATHTGAPWDSAPRFGAAVQLSRDLMGGDRVTAVLALATAIGLAGLFGKTWRRTKDATAMWAMISIPTATLALAWIASHITPAWVSRYFAPVLAAVLLLAALGIARAGVAGPVALALMAVFLVNPKSYVAPYKSDMRDVGGEMAQYVHPGDLVISGQPDQISLAWYYLPGGLRWADLTGPVADPRYFNWVDALNRLRHAEAGTTLDGLVASLKPGQQLLFVRPLTEGAKNWEAPWTQLVRRRAAQWGALLTNLTLEHKLTTVAWAPHSYRGSSTVGDSAMLYRKVG
jgi:4-amino-4-deoxy-L-arabinose transferase-like glycosyltransferase